MRPETQPQPAGSYVGRLASSAASDSFVIPASHQLCKQRWETNAVAANDALEKMNLRLSSNPLLCYYPHFLILNQAPKYRKSDWQFRNIGRTSRYVLDPRSIIHFSLITSLHACYQKEVNRMDRVPTENGPSGHDLPMCLESTFNIFQPLWQRLAAGGVAG